MDTIDQTFNSFRPEPASTGAAPAIDSTVAATFNSFRPSHPPVGQVPKTPLYQTPEQAQKAGDIGWQAALHVPETLIRNFWSGVQKDTPTQIGAMQAPTPMTSQEATLASRFFPYASHYTGDLSSQDPNARMTMMNAGIQPNTVEMQPHWSARTKGTLPTNAKGWTTAMWSQNSLPAKLVQSATFAPELEQARYDMVHSYMNAQGIVANASRYTPAQVQAAQKYMQTINQNVKNSNNPWYIAKQAVHSIVKGGVSGLAKGLVTDPELLLPIFGTSSTLYEGMLQGGIINAGVSAGQQASTPTGITGANTLVAGGIGAGIGAIAHGAGKLLGKEPEDTTTTGGTGGTPSGERKVFTDDDEAPPSNSGATAKATAKGASENATPKVPASVDKIPQTDSGQPLHPYTTVDSSKNVDLTGGVSKDGRTVFISKEVPKELTIDDTPVDVHDAIALHERAEWPLMHLDKPMPVEDIARLRTKIGGARIPKDIYNAMREGTPLTYQQAHHIATLAENHYVQTRYDINPEEYQKALAPYIEKAREAAQKEGGAPSELDAKPNRDSGELEEYHNAQDDTYASPIENNASDESAASLEAIRRQQSERAAGRDRYLLKPNGQVLPLIGPDAVDHVPQRGEVVVQRGVGNTPYTILSHNTTDGLAHNLLARATPALDTEYASVANDREVARSEAIRKLLDGEESPSVSLSQKIASLRSKLDKGKLTPEQFVESVQALHNTAMERSIFKKYLGSARVRDPNYIHERLYRAVREDTIPPATANLMHWLLDQNPSIAHDLGISIHDISEHGDIAGFYDRMSRVIHIASDPSAVNVQTGIHEIMHHAERMLPDELRQPILDEYKRRLESAIKKTKDPDILDFLKKAQEYSKNPSKGIFDATRAAYKKLQDKLGDKARQLYQYTNPSEFWAENASALLERRFHVENGGVWGKIHQWLSDFVQHLRGIVGLSSHTPILDALDHLLGKSEGEFITPKMLAEVKAYPSLSEHISNSEGIPETAKLANEQELVERAKGGDKASFETLFRAYYQRLKNYLEYNSNAGAKAIRSGGVTADDLAQTAFIKAHQHLNSFEGNSSFYTWLHRIAENEAKQALRTRSSRPEESLDQPVGRDPYEGDVTNDSRQADIADEATTPESEAIGRQSAARLNQALSKLPPFQQKLIDLADFQLVPNTEIAQQLGLPQSTVNTALMRARAFLERELSSDTSGPNAQRGFISHDTLKRMARFSLVTGAAIYGYNKDKSISGTLKYALGALGATAIPYVEMFRSMRNLSKEGIDLSAKEEVYKRGSDIIKAKRHLHAFVQNIIARVPTEDRRIAITHWLEGDKTIPLTDQEHETALIVRNFLDQIGAQAKGRGIVKELLDNYVTHIFSKADAAKINQHFENAPETSPASRFGKERHIKLSLKEISEQTGMQPLTMDIAKIMHVYGRSMLSAIANKDFIASLKARGLIRRLGPGTGNWENINHTSLKNLKVHPAIAAELRAVLENDNPGMFRGSVMLLNSAQKRLVLSTSLFHLKNVADLTMAAFNNPFKALKVITQSATGTGKYHAMIKEPQIGDLVDQAAGDGLNVQFTRGSGATMDPDVTGNFGPAMQRIQHALDNMLPFKTKLGTGLVGILHKWQATANKLIFELGATGMSLAIYDHVRTQLINNNMRALGRDLTEGEIKEFGRQAADFTNTHMRSVNWLMMAENTTNKYMRNALLELASKKGVNAMELGIFAPTWDAGMIRGVAKMADFKGTDWKGFVRARTQGDLHRQAAIRTALIYLTLANGINMLTSGHHIWDNKDPTMLDLGDGVRMQWSKSLMEPFKMVQSPVQETLNKTSALVKDTGEFSLNRKYLSSKGSPAITKQSGIPGALDKLGYLAKQSRPINWQQFGEYGTKGMVASELGVPMYNKPKSEKKSNRKWVY